MALWAGWASCGLRSMIWRWHASSRIVCAPSPDEDGHNGGGGDDDEMPKSLHPVCVGGGAEAGWTVVSCEVVLFEHLLWILENTNPQPKSLDELVEYAC